MVDFVVVIMLLSDEWDFYLEPISSIKAGFDYAQVYECEIQKITLDLV